MIIPFNKPLTLGSEESYLADVLQSGKFSAPGSYNRKCCELLQNITDCHRAFLTSNCTSALEMATLLLNIQPEDEIIMPSFTHVGTANPFLRAGAKIVWCDIRQDTKNIDENLLETLITKRTKAIVVIHYAGISCEMKKIGNICRQHHIQLIEDCAMALGSEFDGKPLGSFGNLAALSFHETKNIHCGEGGALLVNDSTLLEAAEILINCGTNRSQFEQGKTDHYSWTAKSGNFQLSELQAAFLYPQLLERKKITETRLVLWNRYQQNLSAFLPKEKLPVVTENCRHNAHLFYLLLDSARQRKEMIRFLQEAGIETVFHYIPLHNAPLWKSPNAALPVTEDVAARILRLPLYYELRCEEVDYLCSQIREFLM